MANGQNTAAGTSNGGDLVTPTRNSFLEAIGGLVNVGTSVLDSYGSFLERKAAIKANSSQNSNPPSNNNVAPLGNGFLSNPEAMQQILLYSAAAVFLTVGAIYVIRKAS